MKTPRFNISIVTALAVGTLILICSADARPKNTLAHYGRRAEDCSTPSEPKTRVAGKAKHLPNEKVLARLEQPQVASYRRYRLIDLGTLGGPNASQVFPAVTLNNRGDVIAQASTDMLNPYPLYFLTSSSGMAFSQTRMALCGISVRWSLTAFRSGFRTMDSSWG